MGTEVAVSFSTLRTQLQNEISSLYKIDENIKKTVQTSGRYSDRFNNQSGDYAKNGPRLGRKSFPDNGNNNFNKNDELFGKRKNETKTVFSRLSARAGDSDNEEEGLGPKRARVSSAVSRELPTRAAVLRAQSGDEQARKRNKRMFGSLLGTLQKFKQEEIVLQTKEDKKAQVEKKIEEQARQLKEKEQKERKVLFAEREHKRATIKTLEAKMHRVQEFERWETSQRSLGNFILTKTKPHIYWIPKKMSEKTEEKLSVSKKFHEKCLARKREELQQDLERIEQRSLRQKGPGAKENNPNSAMDSEAQIKDEETDRNNEETVEHEGSSEDKSVNKRDKFAADADEKEESDNEDHHDEQHQLQRDHSDVKDEKESDEVKMETSIEDSKEETQTSPEGGAPNDTALSRTEADADDHHQTEHS